MAVTGKWVVAERVEEEQELGRKKGNVSDGREECFVRGKGEETGKWE